MKYRVRFHLQRGQHYMHWQIRAWDGTVKYLDPKKYQIEMRRCTLAVSYTHLTLPTILLV